jgi:glycosyltransferase involved in cell wall biosynthesis
VLIVPLYPQGAATDLPDWMADRCEDVRWAGPTVEHNRDSIPEVDDERWLRAWIEEVARAYHGESFDTIHVFRLATLRYARSYLTRAAFQSARRQLDLDDIESRTQYRLAMLYARHNLEAEHAEAARLAQRAVESERQLLSSWDRIFICSEDDRAYLAGKIPNHRAEIVVLPNLVQLPDNPPPPRRTTPLTLLYVGTLGYFPNADGVIWFCREVLPVIRELSAIPIRLLIVGTGASDDVRDLAHIPEVEVVGEVERVDEWYRRADLVVVPLRAGGGTRIKLIEAFAHQRPVVSTSIAAEGLAVVDGKHLLIGDRPAVFARHCLRLLHDSAFADRLAENGRRLVEERYALPALESVATHAR